MRFEFIADEHVKVKTFLKKHQVSKGLLAKIKFSGGQILVNGVEQNAIYLLDIGDKVSIDIPSEIGYEGLEAIDRDLDIDFEKEMSRIQKEMSNLMKQEKETQRMLEEAFRGIGYEID